MRRERTGALGRFIDNARFGEAAKDELLASEPDLRGDVRVDALGRQATVEPDGYVDDDTFDMFRDAVRNVSAVSGGRQNRVIESRVDEDLKPPDPREVHQSRSEYAQAQDEARNAQITTSPTQYAADPDSFDFPGVDTGPRFRNTFGDDPSSQSLNKVQQTAFGERDSSLGDLFNR
jgi:hypothetical protein